MIEGRNEEGKLTVSDGVVMLLRCDVMLLLWWWVVHGCRDVGDGVLKNEEKK